MKFFFPKKLKSIQYQSIFNENLEEVSEFTLFSYWKFIFEWNCRFYFSFVSQKFGCEFNERSFLYIKIDSHSSPVLWEMKIRKQIIEIQFRALLTARKKIIQWRSITNWKFIRYRLCIKLMVYQLWQL